MKKNPFLIDKKIIVTDNQTTAIKGGKGNSGDTTISVVVSAAVCLTLTLDCDLDSE